MHTSTVTRKGQIVIPAPLRRKLGFEEGTKVVITETDDGVAVRPMNRAYFEELAGMLPEGGKLVEALLEERKKDRERENRQL